jgi:hypothetical protein
LSASTGSPTSRPKPPSATDGFARRTEFANPDRRGTCVDQPLSRVGLSKSEIALSKREVWGVRRVGMPSTPDVPSLRYVRGQPSFDAGTTLVPALLGRNPDELENSEDRRSAGGHGNQHVRLRGASIDASTVCPAPSTACCRGPGKLSDPKTASTAAEQGADSCRRGYFPTVTGIACRRSLQGDRIQTSPRPIRIQAFPWLAAGPGVMLGYVIGRLRRTYRFNPMTR